jgi:hypothetical protein
MFRALIIELGWRGKKCEECGFSNAAHSNHDLEWHPDDYPCESFSEKKESKLTWWKSRNAL